MTVLERSTKTGTTYEMWDKARRERWPHASHSEFQSFAYNRIITHGSKDARVADWGFNYIRDQEETTDMPNASDITQTRVLGWLLANRVTLLEADIPSIRETIVQGIIGSKPSPTGISKVRDIIRTLKGLYSDDNKTEEPTLVTKRYRVCLTFKVRKDNVETMINMNSFLRELLEEHVETQRRRGKEADGSPWEELVDFGIALEN